MYLSENIRHFVVFRTEEKFHFSYCGRAGSGISRKILERNDQKHSRSCRGPKVVSGTGTADQSYSAGDLIEFETSLFEVGTVVVSPSLEFNFGTSNRSAD